MEADRLLTSGSGLEVHRVSADAASAVVVERHYLHRRPPISHAFGLYDDGALVGVVTYGTPASRHLQKSACPSDPARVIELNRLWRNAVPSRVCPGGRPSTGTPPPRRCRHE